MNQSKRGKGRGGFGLNRGRRGPNSGHSHTYGSQNDESRQHSPDIYPNSYLVHAIMSLLGCQVEVTLQNGTVYDGILKTVSNKLDVALDMAHKLQKKNGHQKIEEIVQSPSRENIIDTLVLGLKHIVSIEARDVDLEEIKKSDTFTDQAISSKLNGQSVHERELQKWEDPSGENLESLMLEDTSMKNGLDPAEMFATNEKMYGVTSSYDHEMLSYTTPVEGSKELHDRAAILAREIEQGNSFAECEAIDSGKTEEELFSSVVRNSQAHNKFVSQQTKSKVQHGVSGKDEYKREVPTVRDMPANSPPKPQRVQHRERDNRSSDEISKAVGVEIKTPSREADALTATPIEQGLQPCPTTGKTGIKAADSGIPIVNIKSRDKENTTIKVSGDEDKDSEPKKVVDDLKDFAKNFQLAEQGSAPSDEDCKKKDTCTDIEQSSIKDQSTSNVSEGQAGENDPPKAQEPKKPESPPKPSEEKTTFKWNLNAKEFKPASNKTPTPTTPQTYQGVPGTISPTQGPRPSTQHIYIRHPHSMKPRSPFNNSPLSAVPRYYRPDPEHAGNHGASTMTAAAAAATGSPIIAQPHHYPQFILAPPHPGMVQQMQPQGSYMIHPQSTQQHYMAPQPVGMATSQGMAQNYQENSSMPIYVPSMAQTPSYQGSPQPSPTTQTQFLPYMQQVIPQQQGNQPPMGQAVMAHSPSQHPQPVFVLPQTQGGPQPMGMQGLPGQGPNNPMMPQFLSDCAVLMPRYCVEERLAVKEHSVQAESMDRQEEQVKQEKLLIKSNS